MAAMDDHCARLTVLEMIVRQLVTHHAIRSDDPLAWVRTRKALALSAIDRSIDLTDQRAIQQADADCLRAAVRGFFAPVEQIAAEYDG